MRLCRRVAGSRDTRGATLGARAARRCPTRRRLMCRRRRVFQDRLWDVDDIHATACHGERLCHGRGKARRHGRGRLRGRLLQLALHGQVVFYRSGAGNASAGVSHGELIVVEGIGHGDGARYPAADGLMPGSRPLRGGGGWRAPKYLGLHVDVVDRGRVPWARQEELARRRGRRDVVVGGGGGGVGDGRCWWWRPWTGRSIWHYD